MASLSSGPSAVGHGVHDHGKDGKQDVLSASPRIISIALLPPLMQVLLVVVERLRFASVTLAGDANIPIIPLCTYQTWTNIFTRAKLRGAL